jgi:hypothetical protein
MCHSDGSTPEAIKDELSTIGGCHGVSGTHRLSLVHGAHQAGHSIRCQLCESIHGEAHHRAPRYCEMHPLVHCRDD